RPPAAAESAAVPAVPAAAPATAPPLSPGAPPPPQRPGIHSALAAPPQTAEDVGRLLENRDALDTIIALENQGRYMEGIIAGWSSGHRQEPMTEVKLAGGDIHNTRPVWFEFAHEVSTVPAAVCNFAC
ncbi:unnamed protein product, partial [Prorocentrum cordatum]